MQRQAVESGNIRSIGHDPATNTLEVEFKHGGVYQYPSCGADLCERFLTAPSKGAFFGKHIKNLPFRKVEAP